MKMTHCNYVTMDIHLHPLTYQYGTSSMHTVLQGIEEGTMSGRRVSLYLDFTHLPRLYDRFSKSNRSAHLGDL